MIFTPEHIALIASGKKTQTRRLFKGLEVRTRATPRGTVIVRPWIPVVGKSYAVQPGRGESELFRLTATAVRREPLGEMTHDDAKAEGHPRGVAEFAEAWLDIHEPMWPPLVTVFCPTCTLDADYPADELPPCPQCDGTTEIRIQPIPTPDELMARFRERHAWRIVWVITFEVDPILQGRFLLQHRGGELRGDYTTSMAQAADQDPLMGVVETVDEHSQRKITKDAGTTASQYAAIAQAHIDRDRELLAFEQRMARARRDARRTSVDLRGEIRALDRLLLQGANGDALERQVKRIEGKVDRKGSKAA